MRLIDGDSLAKQWTIASPEPYNTDAAEVLDSIGEAATVDAVEVVRCRDCKYSANAKWNKKGYRICPASHMEITDDDFCSYGERGNDRGQ